ncbi:MAG: hypothetical protein QOF60_3346 [Actinomycetota bacterium]|jgi:hypothetical protein|nr:hypothetical protein [Actinomycetota bacterium]
MAVVDEQSQVEVVVKRLAPDVPDVPLEALESQVRDCFRAWDGVPVRDFVPIFVERQLRKQLLRS